jgi:hypothetical protein
MISFEAKGNFKKVNGYLERLLEFGKLGVLDKYGQMGVEALAAATPKDTGVTAASWSYRIVRNNRGSVSIQWENSNVTHNGIPIVVLLQYGHGTGTGGYVKGIDFINPAIKPIFEKIANDAYREVIS